MNGAPKMMGGASARVPGLDAEHDGFEWKIRLSAEMMAAR
jgi:hypothetical protein